MRTIYIDEDYICHPDYKEGRTPIKTEILDSVCDNSLQFYRFIPAHDEKVDFCQCINPDAACITQKQHDEDNELFNIINGTTPIESGEEA